MLDPLLKEGESCGYRYTLIIISDLTLSKDVEFESTYLQLKIR